MTQCLRIAVLSADAEGFTWVQYPRQMSQTLKEVVTGMSVAHRASLANSVFWELKGHIKFSGSTTAGDSLSKSIPMGCVNLRETRCHVTA